MAKKTVKVSKIVALADRLHECIKADTKNVFAYGEVLTDANKILEHGKWLPWIEEFGISEQSARNYKHGGAPFQDRRHTHTHTGACVSQPVRRPQIHKVWGFAAPIVGNFTR